MEQGLGAVEGEHAGDLSELDEFFVRHTSSRISQLNLFGWSAIGSGNLSSHFNFQVLRRT